MTTTPRDIISYNAQSVIGRKVKRKLVLIESDDWGSISIPSRDALKRMENAGLPVHSHFNKYDNLASKDDIEALSEVLSRFQDQKGNKPLLTINVTTGNPDFDSIRGNGFAEYISEPFIDTIRRNKPGAEYAWKSAIENRLFFPQYHGRDHIHVKRWMEALRSHDHYMRIAFREGAVGVRPEHDAAEYYMAAYDYSDSDEDFPKLRQSIDQGLKTFEDYFGFVPKSFIPPCYICSREILKHLSESGVEGLQGKIIHLLPRGIRNGKRTYKKLHRFPGLMEQTGNLNLVRNIFFEPASNQSFDWVGNAIKRADIAFRWGNPAIINSHRVNYIGSHSEKNRTDGLTKLDFLLRGILDRWPDVEFVSSQELVEIYKKKK